MPWILNHFGLTRKSCKKKIPAVAVKFVVIQHALIGLETIFQPQREVQILFSGGYMKLEVGGPGQTAVPFSILNVEPGSVCPHPSGRGVQPPQVQTPPVKSLPLKSAVKPFSGSGIPISVAASGLSSSFPAG